MSTGLVKKYAHDTHQANVILRANDTIHFAIFSGRSQSSSWQALSHISAKGVSLASPAEPGWRKKLKVSRHGAMFATEGKTRAIRERGDDWPQKNAENTKKLDNDYNDWESFGS